MPYPDIDQLLRDERFDELARLSTLPEDMLAQLPSRRRRLLARVRGVAFPARRRERARSRFAARVPRTERP